MRSSEAPIRGTPATSRGRWAVAGVPHRGWRCVDIEDREAPEHLCEMCEAQMVCFVHVMEHKDYPEVLRVGCVCAGHMEEDLAGARRREAAFKDERARRTRWLSRRWRVSSNGNEFINTSDGFNVVVYRLAGGGWGGRIEHRASGHVLASRRRYATQDAAKLATFDAIVDRK